MARHRIGIAVVTVLLLSLLAGAVVSSWFAIEAQRALRDLRGVLTERAVDAAFSGDTVRTNEAIRRLELAGAAPELGKTLTGLSLLFDGRPEGAALELRKAFRRAINDLDKARLLLADSPLVLTMSLSVLTEGIELANDQGREAEGEAWCAKGRRNRRGPRKASRSVDGQA